jgi:outer membrane protein assembly factor BamB
MKQKNLRLLPAIIIVILQLLFWLIIPIIAPGDLTSMMGVFGGLLGGLALTIWWLFFSRAPLTERWLVFALMIAVLYLVSQFLHESISTAMMGMMFMFYSIPVMSIAFAVWAVAGTYLSAEIRQISLILTIILASGIWTLIRTDGMSGHATQDFAWRWSATAEERLLSGIGDKVGTTPITGSETEAGAIWPGFRGVNRDGVIHGTQINTNWTASPPAELWRKKIGPGCSSFSVKGDHLFTQEQRGEFEMLSCYSFKTGEPVWRHSDSARFWDAHAGAGPRSTPTLSNDRVYTFGATGILNVLNISDGNVIWSRNPANDHNITIPGWGFASSPLVVGDRVIVAIEGLVAAFDIATGAPRWSGHNGGASYSSPHLLTIEGVEQVLFLSNEGACSFASADGSVLWKYSWPEACRIVQPAVTDNGDILVCGGDGNGLRRITVSKASGEWKAVEKWHSSQLRPNFNDFVVHKGFAYGYNGFSLVCIDLKDGTRKWKEGRYGGQILLLADQDLLLVLAENGELALVSAKPDGFTELSRFKAIEGKTWNHPVLAGDTLLLRNTTEMAAYKLSIK